MRLPITTLHQHPMVLCFHDYKTYQGEALKLAPHNFYFFVYTVCLENQENQLR